MSEQITQQPVQHENAHQCCQKPNRMVIGLGILLFASIFILSLAAVTIAAIVAYPNDNEITVVGQGRVPYQPDAAVVTLGAQIDKVDTAENALNRMNEIMNKVVPAIEALGISKDNIQTQSYTVYPQYDYVENVQTLSGYSASQQIIITVHGVDKDPNILSKVLAESAKAGANRVDSISHSSTKLNELKQEARLKALKDARSKATTLAKAAGVKELGEVTGWYETVIQSPEIGTGQYYAAEGMGGTMASPQVPVGNQEIVIEVNLNYESL